MLQRLLSAAILLTGGGYLVALAHGNKRARYLLKPGTMVLIIMLALTELTPVSRYDWLILLGLGFSVVGDIFLMLPDRFLQGLGAFFLAHLCYIAALVSPLTVGSKGLILLTALGLLLVLVYRHFQPGVLRSGGRPMLVAVALYMTVISTMVWWAIMVGSPLVMAGALLFFLSDTLLGWNRFAQRFSWADYGVMTTYYAAQFCLALSLGTT